MKVKDWTCAVLIFCLVLGACLIGAGCSSSSHSGDSNTVQNDLKNEHVGNAEDFEFHRITLDNGQQCIMADTSSDWNIGLSCDWSASTDSPTTTTQYTYVP